MASRHLLASLKSLNPVKARSMAMPSPLSLYRPQTLTLCLRPFSPPPPSSLLDITNTSNLNKRINSDIDTPSSNLNPNPSPKFDTVSEERRLRPGEKLRVMPFGPDKDTDSKDSLWDLYHRWIQFHNLSRSTAEMGPGFAMFVTNCRYMANSMKKGKKPPIGQDQFGLDQFADSPEDPYPEEFTRGPCLKCLVNHLGPNIKELRVKKDDSGKRQIEIVVAYTRSLKQQPQNVGGCRPCNCSC